MSLECSTGYLVYINFNRTAHSLDNKLWVPNRLPYLDILVLPCKLNFDRAIRIGLSEPTRYFDLGNWVLARSQMNHDLNYAINNLYEKYVAVPSVTNAMQYFCFCLLYCLFHLCRASVGTFLIYRSAFFVSLSWYVYMYIYNVIY